MRDLGFESVGTFTLLSNGTDYTSSNYIDLGTITTGSRFTLHTLFDGLYAMFSVPSAFNATNFMIPFMYEADNATFTTNVDKAAIWPKTLTSATGPFRFRVPENVREFIELGATATATTTSQTMIVTAWFEEGARQGPSL